MKSDNEHLISPIAVLTDWVHSHAFETERIYIIDEWFIINLWLHFLKCLCQVCIMQFHSSQLDKCADLSASLFFWLSSSVSYPQDTCIRNSISFFYVRMSVHTMIQLVLIKMCCIYINHFFLEAVHNTYYVHNVCTSIQQNWKSYLAAFPQIKKKMRPLIKWIQLLERIIERLNKTANIRTVKNFQS